MKALRQRLRDWFDPHCDSCEEPLSIIGYGQHCFNSTCPRRPAHLTFDVPAVDPLDVARFWRIETQRALVEVQLVKTQRDEALAALANSLSATAAALRLLAREAATAGEAMEALGRLLPNVPDDLEAAKDARRLLDA